MPSELDLTRRTLMKGLGGAAMSALAGAGHAEQLNSDAGKSPIPVAILLGPNATLIDFAGPYEILGAAAYACGGFNAYTVASTRDPILCDDGRSLLRQPKPVSAPRLVPDFTFADAPAPRIVIIGGQEHNDDQRKLDWIRHVAKGADLVASVCTGAFLLANSGLLDGKSATTNRTAYDAFEKKYPKIKLIRGVRFVDNGSTATATGLTAGVDLALHIVDRFYSRAAAQRIADYEEWSSQSWRS